MRNYSRGRRSYILEREKRDERDEWAKEREDNKTSIELFVELCILIHLDSMNQSMNIKKERISWLLKNMCKRKEVHRIGRAIYSCNK